VKTRDLKAAYDFLEPWALRLFGAEQSINTWDNKRSDGELHVVGGLGTTFIFDVFRIVDPERNRLGNSLQRLMAETVKNLRGPRQGRKFS
jgi:hypothetical protein